MNIKSIKWNGRVQDVTHLGDKTGTFFNYNKAEISKIYRFDNVKEIIEETPTRYMIVYYGGKQIRIFNPIEVEFQPPKEED